MVDPGVWTQPRLGSLGIGYWVGLLVTTVVEVLFTGALSEIGPLVIATLLYCLFLAVMFLLSSVLVTVTLVGIAGLVPGLNLLIWWRKPRRRTPFLRRLSVFTFPYGLLLDWYVRMQLYVQVMILEQHGPKGARRSSRESTPCMELRERMEAE